MDAFHMPTIPTQKILFDKKNHTPFCINPAQMFYASNCQTHVFLSVSLAYGL